MTEGPRSGGGQTSKADLRELKRRVHELEEASGELNLLLETADVGLLHVDAELRIRRYTAGFTGLMKLMPTLIGQPIHAARSRFDSGFLSGALRTVLAGGPRLQREVTTDEGARWLLRVAPRGGTCEQIEGAVLSCVALSPRSVGSATGREMAERTPREVTDAVPVLIAYVDRNKRYLFNNATYERWFGIKTEDMKGRYVRDVLGEERYALVEPYVERVLEGETVTYEMSMTLPNTGARYLRVQYVPDRDEEEGVVGFFAAISDLTERQRAAEEIERLGRELNQRLVETQVILDAVPVGIFVAHDPQCRRMSMNRVAASMLGLDPAANPSRTGPDGSSLPFKLLKNGRELGLDELPIQYTAAHDVAIAGTELELVRADGRSLTLIGRTAPMHDENGAVTGAVGSFLDITDYRCAEVALADARQRLSLHMENTPLAVIEWDADRRITRWSAASERVFGWTTFEAIGRHIQDLPLIHEADLPAVERIMAQLVDGSMERNTWRNRNYRKDKSIIVCDWYNSALRAPTGELISVLSLALDITEHERLGRLLREHAQRLADMDRHKDEFMAMLGHELRNPLVPIFNAAHSLEAEGDREETRQWAGETITRQSQHLLRLVDDLLDLARINRGTIELQLQPVTLGQIVNDAIEANRHLIDERGHDLRLELPHEPVRFLGDGTRLTQVVSNLINNAAKYTPDGGTIALRGERQDDVVMIEVADTGRGIDPADLERIFEVFAEGHSALEGPQEGLGLGLTLVRRLVELHGGEIVASSPGIGKGASFVVRIPVQDAPPEGKPTPAPERDTVHGRHAHRILVVEDQAIVAQSFAVVLRASGHEVHTVYSGQMALEAIDAFKPDVILLDLGLPDMNGHEVAQRLAQRPDRTTMRVVAVSGYVQKELARDPSRMGFDAYLLKPVMPELLDESIARLFDEA